MPLALTATQAEGLPRIPIKATDGRRGGFESLYGEGAVELDALEALRPGELAALVRSAVEPYLDTTIFDRLSQAEDEAEQLLKLQWAEHTKELSEQLAVIDDEVGRIAKKYRKRVAIIAEEMSRELEPLKARLAPLREALVQAHETFNPELPERPQPTIELPDESDWLFDSNREYMEQLAFYKHRKNEQLPSKGEPGTMLPDAEQVAVRVPKA